jgi:hypothetical protein
MFTDNTAPRGKPMPLRLYPRKRLGPTPSNLFTKQCFCFTYDTYLKLEARSSTIVNKLSLGAAWNRKPCSDPITEMHSRGVVRWHSECGLDGFAEASGIQNPTRNLAARKPHSQSLHAGTVRMSRSGNFPAWQVNLRIPHGACADARL